MSICILKEFLKDAIVPLVHTDSDKIRSKNDFNASDAGQNPCSVEKCILKFNHRLHKRNVHNIRA